MAALYNEIEPFACAWLGNLARAGHIPEGKVERRSIVDLRPEDVRDFEQAHFFAGIAGWAHALRLAGWPDDLPVWTASLPCQPWSSAGRKKGADDDRHLWPVFFDLFSALRPPILFGEQVASPDGLKWLDIVHNDLEQAGYSLAVFDLSAAGVGAPHIRQRLYFTAVRRDVEDAARRTPALRDGGASLVALQAHLEGPHDAGRPLGSGAAVDAASGSGYVLAEPYCQRLEGLRLHLRERRSRPAEPEAARGGEAGGGTLAHPERDGSGARRRPGEVQGREVAGRPTVEPDRRGDDGGGLGDAGLDRAGQHARQLPSDEGEHEVGSALGDHASVAPSTTRTPWHPVEWLPCRDGKLRPTQPGLLPLAPSPPDWLGRGKPSLGGMARSNRSGRLKGYGNAIVPELAATFIEAVVDCLIEE